MTTATFTATLDHRTGATMAGGPASRYQRVARCGGRPSVGPNTRPDFAVRRIGALSVVVVALFVGVWLTGQVADAVAGQPVAAAGTSTPSTDATSGAPAVHVARSGDTLWSIADEHRRTVGRSDFIDALVALNGGTSIVVGQAIRLP